MKKPRHTDQQIAQALRQAEAGHGGGGALPQARRERDDVLPLEEAVRRHGSGRAAPGQAARGRDFDG